MFLTAVPLLATKLDPFHADAWAGMAVLNEGQEKSQSAVFYIKKAPLLNNEAFIYNCQRYYFTKTLPVITLGISTPIKCNKVGATSAKIPFSTISLTKFSFLRMFWVTI